MLQSKLALVCEDNVTTSACISKMLENLDYTVDIAYDAMQAESFLANKKYDLMTLDIVLPDKTGWELLDTIRRNDATKNLPVIIISATEPDDIHNSGDYIYWIEKGFEYEAFKSVVECVFDENCDLNRKKILHLEDDEDVLTITKMMLSDFADVTMVNNVTEAMEAINKTVFDIIILDFKLLDETSEKVMDEIKHTINKDAKLILFSAYEPSKSIIEKVDKVILKSTVSSEDFVEHVEELR
jgi:CheY-like chemotaxis protein